jgi:hypothetical protein
MTEEKMKKLREVTKVQCEHGNWNFDPYMHGMANGLLLAVAIMEDKEPEYLEPPKEWLGDENKDL